ncbi:hypothetical protein AAVH_22462 [Aphelenchoides avenae]|nr:hypothetical protein AAVH_22462 [Aphelenchus avenae]
MLDQEALQYPLDPATDDYSPDDPDFIGPGENKLHAKIMKDLAKARRLADSFWQNFRDGSLLELRNRGVDRKRRQRGEETIQPGDLVLVSETDVPRSEWRLALVLELLPHSDGLVRSARIRYASTKRETNRALEHLYPIGKIPRSTAACSTVSRLGICLSVLLSDIGCMSDQKPINDNTNAEPAPAAASQHRTVPISSAGYDSSGEFVLYELTPPSTTATAGQSVTGPAYLAGTAATAPATSDAPAPTYLVGPDVPEPAAQLEDAAGLPPISAPRPPLFREIELQIEHARQVMVAMEEQNRLTDALFNQLRRCIELDAAGLPSEQSYTQLQADVARVLGPFMPSPSPAAPRADPPADQSTTTEEPADQRVDQSTQTDITTVADSEPPADSEADPDEQTAEWLAANNEFWQGITVTGHHVQEEDGTAATYLVAPALIPRAPVDQLPFNSRGLLRALPMRTNWPEFPTLAAIELRVRQFFAHYTLAEEEQPPILEPIDKSTLFTRPAERAQKLSFVMSRTSLMPTRTTWDPLECCDGDGEQDCFHRSIRRLRIIQATRWATTTGPWKNNAVLKKDLQDILDQHVPSFGHMILLCYVIRLYNRDSNVRALVTFLSRMLHSRDFKEEIPELLAKFQPQMISAGTREPWPTDKDLKTAAKRWLCYCQSAYYEIFGRLSGPIIWSPEWMRNKALPSAARLALDKMVLNATPALDAVRQMVYGQYAVKHVLAVMNDAADTFEWKSLADTPDRDLLDVTDILSLAKTIIFADKYTVRDFGAAMKEKIRLHTIPSTDIKTAIHHAIRQYPSYEVDRVIFWFGTDYIVNLNNDDYGTLIGYLSHHYAAHLGYPEQIVIAPPYARTHADSWTKNVLGLLVQKEELLPHARLIIDAHDLRMASKNWPSEHLKPNGRLRNPHIAELRKYHLRKYHGLDLWKYYEVDTPTAPMPPSILSRTIDGTSHGDFVEPGIVEVGAYLAPSETPSTSSHAQAVTYLVTPEAQASPPTSTNTVEQNPRVQDTQAVTDAEIASTLPATPDAAPSSSTDAPAIAASAASQAVPATITDVESRIAPLAADVAQIKEMLFKIAAALPGPSAPSRQPDTEPEADA